MKKFKNEIKNKELKDYIADLSLGVLINSGKMTKSKESVINTKIEFAYLLYDENEPVTLLKVITNNGEVFYFGSQEGKLMLLNEKFTEELFYSTRDTMMKMHDIIRNKEDEQYYFMELY